MQKMEDLRELCRRAFEERRMEDALRLLSKVEQPDPDLVHFCARNGWRDFCRQLVEEYGLSPSDEADVFGGQRPFHVACEYGRVEVVQYLLTLPQVMLTVNERDGGGRSALELACRDEHLSVVEMLMSKPSVHMPNLLTSNKFTVLSLLSIRMSWSTEFPITPYFPVFMAGNTAAGKTTLTKAMMELTQPGRSGHGGEMVTGVKTLTAGICTSQCSGKFWMMKSDCSNPDLSADTGIEIYDLAGHEEYHSSHSAIMASLCLESPAVFVLMVDLTKAEKRLFKEIYKWSNFIEIESSSISASVVVVGSRRDELSSEPQLLASKCESVECIAKDALGKQRFAGFVALDCRRLSSENMELFLTILTKNIKDLAIPGVNKLSFSCHLLHAFLQQVVEVKVISFGSLQELVSRHDVLSPLSEPAMLTSSLGTLADKGLILFLRNNDCLSSSCIVIDKAQVLQEINGTLFAPRSFKEHRQLASNTGIVPVSLFHEIFPHYREVLVAVLTTLQFCHPVEPTLLANIRTNLSPESATSDELLYFPALVSAERPSDLSITEGFGWCTYCTNPRQCLTQRCQDAILLDSTYKHCLPYPAPPDLEYPKEKLFRQLRRSCTVWKNGVHWMTEKGTEAVVQVSEEKRCVSLLVSLNQECPTDSLELRSSVIDTIRSKQKELCSSVQVHEYIISPSQLSLVADRSFSELTVFAVEDVARNLRNNNRFSTDCERKERTSLERLLHFDPYQVLPPKAMQLLFAGDKWREPVPARFFAGKNPLEMAEVTAADMPCSQEGDPLTSATPTSSDPLAAVSQEGAIAMAVLRRYYDHLVHRVHVTMSLAIMLYSMGLLSRGERDQVISAQNVKPLFGTMTLLGAVEARIAAEKSAQPLLVFCQALEQNPELCGIAEDMRKELEGKVHTPFGAVATGEKNGKEIVTLQEKEPSATCERASPADCHSITQYAVLTSEKIDETAFDIFGGRSQEDLKWPKHGLRLAVPADALPTGTTAKLMVKALPDGEFELQGCSALITAVYHIAADSAFNSSITLYLQHCAVIESEAQCSELHFVIGRNTQSDSPCQLKKIMGGVFTPRSHEACISVKPSSIIAAVGTNNARMLYYQQVYHRKNQGIYSWQLDFIVTRFITSHIGMVQKQYETSDWIQNVQQTIEFDEANHSSIPRITLNVVETEDEEQKYWLIQPLSGDTIPKDVIDQCRKERPFPVRRLGMKWGGEKRDDCFPNVSRRVALVGAKPPNDHFYIELPKQAFSPTQGSCTEPSKKPKGGSNESEEELESSPFLRDPILGGQVAGGQVAAAHGRSILSYIQSGDVILGGQVAGGQVAGGQVAATHGRSILSQTRRAGPSHTLPEGDLDISHLRRVIRSLRSFKEWLALGLELEMDYSFLDDIDRDKGGDAEKCKVAMLHAWLQSGRATKSSLVEALGMIGEDDIAANII